MTDRGMSAGMLTAIAGQQFTVAHLAEIYFTQDSPQTTIYICDAGFDIVWNGETYSDTEGLISLDNPGESFDLTVETMSFTISGTELANLSLALTANFTDARFVVRRALLDVGSSPLVIASPVVIWDGRIDSWDFTEAPETGQSTLTWHSSNHWVDFMRVAGRRTNNADQQTFYSTDTGFDYAGKISPTDLKWPGIGRTLAGAINALGKL